jgi:menaquinone-dependent protoporphyrinogen IX oxidase
MRYRYQSTIPSFFTHHAAQRMQQRSIPMAVVDLLLDYADPQPAGNGAVSYSFTETTWADACADLGRELRTYAKYRNTYVVVAHFGQIITAAWKH